MKIEVKESALRNVGHAVLMKTADPVFFAASLEVDLKQLNRNHRGITN